MYIYDTYIYIMYHIYVMFLHNNFERSVHCFVRKQTIYVYQYLYIYIFIYGTESKISRLYAHFFMSD